MSKLIKQVNEKPKLKGKFRKIRQWDETDKADTPMKELNEHEKEIKINYT